MALIDDIKKEIENRKIPKWQKLKEIEDEIKEMLAANLSLKRQVELLLRNDILEKIDVVEYRNILLKHFDYKPKFTKSKKSKKTSTSIKKNQSPKPLDLKKNQSPKEILSQEIIL